MNKKLLLHLLQDEMCADVIVWLRNKENESVEKLHEECENEKWLAHFYNIIGLYDEYRPALAQATMERDNDNDTAYRPYRKSCTNHVDVTRSLQAERHTSLVGWHVESPETKNSLLNRNKAEDKYLAICRDNQEVFIKSIKLEWSKVHSKIEEWMLARVISYQIT